jgi:hypothetical protein
MFIQDVTMEAAKKVLSSSDYEYGAAIWGEMKSSIIESGDINTKITSTMDGPPMGAPSKMGSKSGNNWKDLAEVFLKINVLSDYIAELFKSHTDSKPQPVLQNSDADTKLKEVKQKAREGHGNVKVVLGKDTIEFNDVDTAGFKKRHEGYPDFNNKIITPIEE